MARFEIEGMDEIIEQMKEMGLLTGKVAETMLLAGAADVREAWQETAAKHGYHDTGQMIASIGYPRKPKASSDALSIDIYPQGKRDNGVRNAEVAFILHYGSGKLKGSEWVDEADQESGPRVTTSMWSIWEQFIETGTLPTITIPKWTGERAAARSAAKSSTRRQRKRQHGYNFIP